MSDNYKIMLPLKPRVVMESDRSGTYEVDGLYPGFGHTLGNSLRRIILSSLPGVAITEVKIDGVSHEFSTLGGVKEDIITIILNLKRVRVKMLTDEPQMLSISVRGIKDVTAADIVHPGQVEILNPEQIIAHVTDKNTNFNVEMRVEKGFGYVSKEDHKKEKVEIGAIALDAVFTPIRRVTYEVSNMRVGDKTNFNRLQIFVETDGTITPRSAFEDSISIMISQLRAIVGFKEEDEEKEVEELANYGKKNIEDGKEKIDLDSDALKTRIESLDLSQRTINALTTANIRTVGGLARKKEEDILDIEGIGSKGIQEIKKVLSGFGINLK